MQPYSTVGMESFRSLLHVLEPRYNLPSRTTFAEQIIPAWHKAGKDKLLQQLNAQQYVALTADGWTSRTNDPYLTITVHYLDDWQLVSKVLQTEKIEGKHTGENICLELDAALESWGISSKVQAITIDNAANMVKACSLANLLQIPCFAHTLNLAAQKAEDPSNKFTKFIRPVVAYFHKSHVGWQVMFTIQFLI